MSRSLTSAARASEKSIARSPRRRPRTISWLKSASARKRGDWRAVPGSVQLRVERWMPTPSIVSHTCELGPCIPQVGVDDLPMRQVKCNSPEDLLQAEGWERFDDALRRFAPQEGIYDGVKRNPAPGNVVSASALFDVSCCHAAPAYIIWRAELPAKTLVFSCSNRRFTGGSAGSGRRLDLRAGTSWEFGQLRSARDTTKWITVNRPAANGLTCQNRTWGL